MLALDRKLVRDMGRLWAQVLAVAMVMACGVATLVLAIGASRSLDLTRDAFYDRYRFGSVFAQATRAPDMLEMRLSSISGVSAVETRIVRGVLLDIAGMVEPASAFAISIPDHREARVNRLYLRKGRLPEPGVMQEVAVVETFAAAHRFELGDKFSAILNGRKIGLSITGIVLSPEYVYAIGPGDMVPDQKRFGVFFMSEDALGGIFDMRGSFNDLSLTTTRGANISQIIEAVDDLLKPYGGTGAFDREDQISNAFLDAELDQLWAMAAVIPPIFLFVSAFLVNMILSRLVALEREQIGLLKAVGYSDFAVGLHYAKMVVIISVVGILIGSIAGYWLGAGLTRLYADFFSFPFLLFEHSVDLYLLASFVTVLAGLFGAIRSIRSVVSLPPAVAMRPPAPENYRESTLRRLFNLSGISQRTRMGIRHMVQKPLRSLMTTVGTSMSVALLVTALFSFDSIDYMIDIIFFQSDRQDATLTFTDDLPRSALTSVAAFPGILSAQPFRSVLAILSRNQEDVRALISGVPDDASLSRILDVHMQPMPPPSHGLVISERLAGKLRVRPGDVVEIELTEYNRRRAEVVVSALAESFVGLRAYMAMDALDRLTRQGNRLSGVNVSVDPDAMEDLYRSIKETPAIASIALQNLSRSKFRETIEQNIITMTSVYVALAVIITFGVIYNASRIQFSERARELASLRVMGFTRREVVLVLLIEVAVIVVLSQPLGWFLGWGFAKLVVAGFESDLFKVPLIIKPSTYAISSLVVILAASVSAILVWRRVARLDMVRALKTKE